MPLPTFKARTRRVRLEHRAPGDTGEAEAFEVEVQAVSLAALDTIRAALAVPTLFINGAPSDKPDPKQAPVYESRQNAAMLGVALRGTLTAQPPTTSAPQDWIRFADAVRDELDAAGFTRGDLGELFAALKLLDHGVGSSLGNGSGPAGAA